jgi:uncharacterized protein YwgA
MEANLYLLLLIIGKNTLTDRELQNLVHGFKEVSGCKIFSEFDFRKTYYGYYSSQLEEMVNTEIALGFVKRDERNRLMLTEDGKVILAKLGVDIE